MAQQWQFEQDEQHRWHWKHPEDSTESARSFSSATECMLDAVRCAVQRRRSRSKPETACNELLQ